MDSFKSLYSGSGRLYDIIAYLAYELYPKIYFSSPDAKTSGSPPILSANCFTFMNILHNVAGVRPLNIFMVFPDIITLDAAYID